MINVDYRCLKCGGNTFSVKTAIIPEKNPGLKIELGTYYIKTCLACGYTEFYSAKIVNEEFDKKNVSSDVKNTLKKATV